MLVSYGTTCTDSGLFRGFHLQCTIYYLSCSVIKWEEGKDFVSMYVHAPSPETKERVNDILTVTLKVVSKLSS